MSMLWRSLMVALVVMTAMSGISMANDLVAPEISIARIHSPTVSMEGVQVICSVRVANPNYVDLPLGGAVVALNLAETPSANGSLLRRVVIPSRSIKNVDLLVDITMSAAATWLPMYFEGEAFKLPFEVRGFVDVERDGLGRVPFHEIGEVSMTADGLVVEPPSL